MPAPNKTSTEPQIGGAAFATTHWSAVLSAAGAPSTSSAQALEKLCRDYWFPLYAFIRREGHGPIEAQDLTQEFFARLLQGNYLASVGPERGKFRSFLLASLKHFLANEWDHQHRQKRGGGALILSLDDETAETRYLAEATPDTTAEKIYERRWAQTVVQKVLEQLRAEAGGPIKQQRFDVLKDCLVDDPEAARYSDLARKLGLTINGVKSAVHRLRQRFRELFRQEIAQTVSCPEEIDGEIRYLFNALAA
jgi:RNA polymerase sigma-70 factor (ECF subfamily)